MAWYLFSQLLCHQVWNTLPVLKWHACILRLCVCTCVFEREREREINSYATETEITYLGQLILSVTKLTDDSVTDTKDLEWLLARLSVCCCVCCSDRLWCWKHSLFQFQNALRMMMMMILISANSGSLVVSGGGGGGGGGVPRPQGRKWVGLGAGLFDLLLHCVMIMMCDDDPDFRVICGPGGWGKEGGTRTCRVGVGGGGWPGIRTVWSAPTTLSDDIDVCFQMMCVF